MLGIQEHPVDRQFVQILIGTPATRPGERDNVVVVGGVVERNGEIGPAVGAVSPSNGPACENAAGNVEDAALARHQCEQIGVRLWRPDLVRNFLGKGCGGDQKQDSGKDSPVEAHRHVRSIGNQIKQLREIQLQTRNRRRFASLVRPICTEMRLSRKTKRNGDL